MTGHPDLRTIAEPGGAQLLRTLVPLCVALGAATGCTSSAPLVDYSVTGGFSGAGDGTSLHITADGVATRASFVSSTRIVQLDALHLADLEQKIAGAQFPSLQPLYRCSHCADDYRYNVTVLIDGSSYATSVEGRETAVYPDSLRTLLLLLDQIAAPPR